VKKLVVHVLILILLVFAACNLRGGNSNTEAPRQPQVMKLSDEADAQVSDWRRTATGWERRATWNLSPPVRTVWHDVMAVHPVVWATLQVLVSVGALACFEDEVPRNTTVPVKA